MAFETNPNKINLRNYNDVLAQQIFRKEDIITRDSIYDQSGKRKPGIPFLIENPETKNQITFDSFLINYYVLHITNWAYFKNMFKGFDVYAEIYINGRKIHSNKSGFITIGRSPLAFIYIKKDFTITDDDVITVILRKRAYVGELDKQLEENLIGDYNLVRFYEINENNNYTIELPLSVIDDLDSVHDILFMIKGITVQPSGDKIYWYSFLDDTSECVTITTSEPYDLSGDGAVIYDTKTDDLTEELTNTYKFQFNFNIKENEYIFVGVMNRKFFSGEVSEIDQLNLLQTTSNHNYYYKNSDIFSSYNPEIDRYLRFYNDNYVRDKKIIFDLSEIAYQTKVFINGQKLVAGIHYDVFKYNTVNNKPGSSLVIFTKRIASENIELEYYTDTSYYSVNSRNYIFKVIDNEGRIADLYDQYAGSYVPGVIDMYRYYQENIAVLPEGFLKPLNHDGVQIYSNGILLNRGIDYDILNNFQIVFHNLNYVDNDLDNIIEICVTLTDEMSEVDDDFDGVFISDNEILYNVQIPSEIETNSVNINTIHFHPIISTQPEIINDRRIKDLNKSKYRIINNETALYELVQDIHLIYDENSNENEELIALEGLSIVGYKLKNEITTITNNTAKINTHLNLSNYFNKNELAVYKNDDGDIDLYIYDNENIFKKISYDDEYKNISSFNGEEGTDDLYSLREKTMKIIGVNTNRSNIDDAYDMDIMNNGTQYVKDGSLISFDSGNEIIRYNNDMLNTNPTDDNVSPNLNTLKDRLLKNSKNSIYIDGLRGIEGFLDVQIVKLKNKVKERFEYIRNKYSEFGDLFENNNVLKTAEQISGSHSYLVVYNSDDVSHNVKITYTADVFDYDESELEGGIKYNTILQSETFTVNANDYEIFIPYAYHIKKNGISRRNFVNTDLNITIDVYVEDDPNAKDKIKFIVGK